MAKIINIRQFSKQKARQDRVKQAAENAVKYGRTRPEKQRDELNAASLRTHLDLHKREDP